MNTSELQITDVLLCVCVRVFFFLFIAQHLLPAVCLPAQALQLPTTMMLTHKGVQALATNKCVQQRGGERERHTHTHTYTYYTPSFCAIMVPYDTVIIW